MLPGASVKALALRPAKLQISLSHSLWDYSRFKSWKLKSEFYSMKAIARLRTTCQCKKTQSRLGRVRKHCICITERLQFYARASNGSSFIPPILDMQDEHHHQPTILPLTCRWEDFGIIRATQTLPSQISTNSLIILLSLLPHQWAMTIALLGTLQEST